MVVLGSNCVEMWVVLQVFFHNGHKVEVWVIGWAEDGAGRVENYYDPSTGDTWDANGNYSGNMNDWLWD